MYSPFFAGRNLEMAVLDSALKGMLSGQGHVVMVSGEPGIGKTRLAREFAKVAQERNVEVLWGSCPEVQGAPPYWPWIQLIRSVDPSSITSTDSISDDAFSELSRLVPELGAHRSSVRRMTDPDSGRFLLFDSVAAVLRNAAESRPLILVFDDLHQADVPSLQMLEYVARETSLSRLMILGTYRDVEVSTRHPLRDSLGSLAHLESFRRINLSGLDIQQVSVFVQQSMEEEYSKDLVSALHLRSEGNPLYLIEMLRMLQGENRTGTVQNIERETPETVRDVIRRRLNRLSASCNEMLTRASVLGRDFQVALLGQLLEDLPTGGLLEALDEALRAGIIENSAPPAAQYRFSHILIKETLENELSLIQKARLHGQAGKAVEQLYRKDLINHASELAFHFSMGAPVIGTEECIRYSLMAGERALDTYAWEDALSHFQRGLDTSDRIADERRAALLFGIARAQTALASFEEAWENILSALDIYLAAGDVSNAVAVAEYPVPYVTGTRGVTDRMEKALSLVLQGSIGSGRLLSRYGRLLNLVESDYERAVLAFDQALEIASRGGDEELERHVLMDAADADMHQLRWEDLLNKCLKAMNLGRPQRDPSAQFWPMLLAGQALTVMGRPKEAEPHVQRAVKIAQTLNNGELLIRASYNAEKLHHNRGEWDSAKSVVEQGLSVAPSYQHLLGLRAVLAYETGSFEEGNAFVERLFKAVRSSQLPGSLDEISIAATVPHLSRITGNDEWLDIAEKAARSLISNPYATPLYTVGARMGLGFIAAIRKDAGLAAEQYPQLLPHRGTVFPFTSVDRVLGLIAVAMGELEPAITHFLEAEDFLGKAGYGPELAWSYHDHAQAIHDLNAIDLCEVAERLASEGLSISRDLGMDPLARRLETLLDHITTGPGRRATSPGGLTERQVEVLRLLALGKTNRTDFRAARNHCQHGTAPRRQHTRQDELVKSHRGRRVRQTPQSPVISSLQVWSHVK